MWIVKANTAGCRDDPLSGSHGMSGIVDPTGIVRVEASIYDEEIVITEVDIDVAEAAYAKKSVLDEYFLAKWWKKGAEDHVFVHKR